MFSGMYDRIVDIETNREYIGSIPSVIEHNEINADHLTFIIGKTNPPKNNCDMIQDRLD